MEKISNMWVDDNNNSWSAYLETEESAQKKSDSLTHCSFCFDCFCCSNCANCANCSGCHYCSDCANCSGCHYCSDCANCSGCYGCYGCSICANCYGCSNCSGFKSNPERIVSQKIGSRDSQSTYYWTDEHEQIVCGCFKGTLDKFEKRVNLIHKDNEHGKNYMAWISKIRQYKQIL